jgi:hypothetical protein
MFDAKKDPKKFVNEYLANHPLRHEMSKDKTTLESLIDVKQWPRDQKPTDQ